MKAQTENQPTEQPSDLSAKGCGRITLLALFELQLNKQKNDD